MQEIPVFGGNIAMRRPGFTINTREHTYALAGTYTATLTIEDMPMNPDLAKTNTCTKEITVDEKIDGLEVNITSPSSSVCSEEDITLTGEITGGTSPYICKWDFDNDGTIDETQTDITDNCEISHAFSENSTVKLIVTDSTTPTNTSESTFEITVDDCSEEFIVDMNPNTNQSIRRGNSITYRPVVSGGVEPYTCTWDFGDGSTPTTNDCSSNVSHLYNSIGTFTTSLTATDNAEHTGSKSITVNVTSTPPPPSNLTVNMSPSTNQNIEKGESITFRSIVSGGTSPYNCTWDFGDGSPSVRKNCSSSVNHTYNKTGNFTTTLNAHDSSGQHGSKSIKVNVTNHASTLTVQIHPSALIINTGESITYSAQTTGGTSPIMCTWRFGDGAGGGIIGKIEKTQY